MDRTSFTKHEPLWLGLFGSFLLSTKVSMAFFCLLPMVLFTWKTPKDAIRLSFRYGLSLFFGFILWNLPAFRTRAVFNSFLHDYVSNFFHYATGSHEHYTVVPGWDHAVRVFGEFWTVFGYLVYLFPVVLALGLWKARRNERFVLIAISVLAFLSLKSLIAQAVFIPRNYIPFYVPTILVLFLSLEIVLRELRARYSAAEKLLSRPVAGFSLMALGLVVCPVLISAAASSKVYAPIYGLIFPAANPTRSTSSIKKSPPRPQTAVR